MTRFIVMTSSAAIPGTGMGRSYGRYRDVAVVEVEDGTQPKMISKRAKGVVRIVRVWKRQFVGKTLDCAYHRALGQAQALADQLDAERSG